MVLIVHLDKSILFLDYKNILISITSLQQKISMKKKICELGSIGSHMVLSVISYV